MKKHCEACKVWSTCIALYSCNVYNSRLKDLPSGFVNISNRIHEFKPSSQ